MVREPSYCHHKGKNLAYVRLNGRMFYLGTYNSSESKVAYARLKAEWLSNQHHPKFSSGSKDGLPNTMARLATAYLAFAKDYYKKSTELENLRRALLPIAELYAQTPSDQFGPLEFKACRDWWLSDPSRSRQYVNKMTKYLLRILRWGAAEALLPVSVFEACRCVAPLKVGRTAAPESKPVLPVSDAIVDATIKQCTPVVADMIEFQRICGCRPGELIQITPSMVDRSGEVWRIEFSQHKNAHRGLSRCIFVGPRGQKILKKYLSRDPDAPCFSPMESEQQRQSARHAARTTPLSCGNRPGSNRKKHPTTGPGRFFTTGTYGQSIRNAAKRAQVAHWHPNQLRHSAATRIRKEFGLEGAQVILGHSEIGVTQIYAERDSARAIQIAKQVG